MIMKIETLNFFYFLYFKCFISWDQKNKKNCIRVIYLEKDEYVSAHSVSNIIIDFSEYAKQFSVEFKEDS